MDPSTEQLIRDYLNRVAVAARRSMGPDEVRAFLARLRESIERQCTAHGVASPADVSSVLAALGGPEALVGLEHARLAAAESGPRRGGSEPGAATDPMAAVPGGTRHRRTRSGGKAAADAGGEAAADAGGEAAAGSGGRLLRLPGRPRLLGRRRDGGPAAVGEPDTGPGAGGPADEDQAIQRRPVTARRRPGAILPDKSKSAMRLRGPQGRDSPVLQPVKRNRSAWQEQEARGGLRAAGQPDDAGQPGQALTFVPRPTPGSRRAPTGRAKFYPVRGPAAWPASSGERKPPPGRGPAAPPARPAEPGPGPGRTADPAGHRGSGPEPVFHREQHAPGSEPVFGPSRAAGQDPASGPQRATGPEPAHRPEQAAGAGRAPGQGQESGPGPDYQPGHKYRLEGKDQPEQVYRPRQKYRPASPPGQQPVLHSKPALRSWPGQEPDPADEPGGGPVPADESGGGPVPVAADPPPGRPERVVPGLRAAASWAFRLARRRPLEATAIVLIGLGGLIYPPVWLVGALVALPSRLWDIRDKWFGLAAPAIVTIVGSVGLAMGGTHQTAGAYVHAVLTIGGYLMRAGAVIGASYLTWRVHRGQRRPAQPPWRRGYR